MASSNPGKLAEIRALLAPLEIEVVSQGELGIPDAEEPHFTFLENALAKARHTSRASGLPALADDSGICVHALGGEPGVNSAYYGGTQGSREERDARNNAKLLAAIAGEPDKSAHYACVMVLVRHPNDPQPLVAEGSWRGEITAEPRGTNGFGYDPIFIPEGFDCTFGEMDPAQKEAMSHRARAFSQLKAALFD